MDYIRLFPLKTIGTCYGDLLSFISPTFFTDFGWRSVVIKWFVWYGTSKQNGLLFERWMMKRTFVFGFERTETRMPLEICFTPFRFIFFRWVPLEGLLIFLWKLGLSINRFNAIVLQSFNDNYRPYNNSCLLLILALKYAERFRKYYSKIHNMMYRYHQGIFWLSINFYRVLQHIYMCKGCKRHSTEILGRIHGPYYWLMCLINFVNRVRCGGKINRCRGGSRFLCKLKRKETARTLFGRICCTLKLRRISFVFLVESLLIPLARALYYSLLTLSPPL